MTTYKTFYTLLLVGMLTLASFASHSRLIIRGAVSSDAGGGTNKLFLLPDFVPLNFVPGNVVDSIPGSEPSVPENLQVSEIGQIDGVETLRVFEDLARFTSAFPVSTFEYTPFEDVVQPNGEVLVDPIGQDPDFNGFLECDPGTCSYEFAQNELFQLSGFADLIVSNNVFSTYEWSIFNSLGDLIFNSAPNGSGFLFETSMASDIGLDIGDYTVTLNATHVANDGYRFGTQALGEDLVERGTSLVDASLAYNLKIVAATVVSAPSMLGFISILSVCFVWRKRTISHR